MSPPPITTTCLPAATISLPGSVSRAAPPLIARDPAVALVEVVHREVDAVELAAGRLEVALDPRADRDDHGVVGGGELVAASTLPPTSAPYSNLMPSSSSSADAAVDHPLLELRVRDAEAHQPAGRLVALVDGDLVADLVELVRRRRGRPGRSRSRRSSGRCAAAGGCGMIQPSSKPRWTIAYSICLIITGSSSIAEHAGRLARRRADQAGELGEVVGRVQLLASRPSSRRGGRGRSSRGSGCRAGRPSCRTARRSPCSARPGGGARRSAGRRRSRRSRRRARPGRAPASATRWISMKARGFLLMSASTRSSPLARRRACGTRRSSARRRPRGERAPQRTRAGSRATKSLDLSSQLSSSRCGDLRAGPREVLGEQRAQLLVLVGREPARGRRARCWRAPRGGRRGRGPRRSRRSSRRRSCGRSGRGSTARPPVMYSQPWSPTPSTTAEGARVADREALAGEAAEERAPAGRAVERDVADDHVLLRRERRRRRRVDREHAAGEALADVVVGLALERRARRRARARRRSSDRPSR